MLLHFLNGKTNLMKKNVFLIVKECISAHELNRNFIMLNQEQLWALQKKSILSARIILTFLWGRCKTFTYYRAILRFVGQALNFGNILQTDLSLLECKTTIWPNLPPRLTYRMWEIGEYQKVTSTLYSDLLLLLLLLLLL